ncbi:putative lipoprotein [Methylocaldum marinum]|uniref:Putative lipoprotein n=1 Tax=Methylocaldum marinum TaxID=1432792 RepID=A0A250KSB2_9GAMM|nr:hypothetical protein [Methylocaldum marinum]BBA34550.1 putative lipoprotein [Methylocaldum marinum]
MKFKSALVALFVAAFVLLAGCRTSPVYNVYNAPVMVTGTKPYTSGDVEKAIIRAGASLGWQIRKVAPGKLIGTLFIRSHMAEVDIAYGKDKYDIRYRNSNNLNYDGIKIHSNYNGWIQNLDNAIKRELLSL